MRHGTKPANGTRYNPRRSDKRLSMDILVVRTAKVTSVHAEYTLPRLNGNSPPQGAFAASGSFRHAPSDSTGSINVVEVVHHQRERSGAAELHEITRSTYSRFRPKTGP